MSWRARAVFVSGTFRDMHEERDLLAARAFPELGEKLAVHYTILERVDLRVGVETRGLDDDHAKQELVLKVCLEDVRRCRPFLIVLFGDRYGWVPPPDRARVAADEAGFRTAIEGKSVTALEIEFGLLGDPEQQTRSRIYFRKLDYTGMDETHAIVYSDARAAVSALLSAEDRARAAQRAAALAALQRQLREDPVLGPRCRDYPAVWDPTAKKVTGLGAFIADVVKDLLPEMVAEAKEQVAAAKAGKLPTALEQFVAERSRGFRGRAGMVARLCAHATQPGDADRRGLVVAGASGGGKSAIFARVYEELTGAKGEGFWLLAHAAGIDPRSTSVLNLLEDWVAILADKLGVASPLAAPASDPRETRLGADKRPKPEEAFADLLFQAAKKNRVVLLLDALDRFERTPQAEQLTWLPAHLPANVRLIATAVTGPETAALARRPDFAVESLVPLTKDEASEIAQSVYERYHRQPNQEAVRVLGEKAGPDGAPAHGNALWLVSALEEMNLLDGDDFRRAEVGTEGTDEDRLHAMVVGEARAMPGDVEGLYARIFARAGRRVSDDPREGRALARAFAVVIALSRGGLRERDLAALIPGIARLLDPSGSTLAWDALAFASLRRALRAHMVRRGEDDRWDFHHRQARSAAERAYLPDAGTAKQIHALVADHLLGLPADDPLRESEAMYHLIHAGAAEKAARLYAGELTPGGLAGCQETLARHALQAEGLAWVTGLLEVEALGSDMLVALGERYLYALDPVFDRMYVVLPRAGVARASERLFRRLLAANPGNSGLLRDVSVSLNNVGGVQKARGNLDAASAAYGEMLRICRGLSDPQQPQTLRDVSVSLDRVGGVEMARGNLDAASAAYAEMLRILRGLSDPQQPQTLRDVSISLNKVGGVEMARGNLDAASAAYGESLKIARGLSDPQQPQTLRDVSVSLDNVGGVEMARGNLDAASAAYGESLRIARGLSDPQQPQTLRDVSVSLDRVGGVEMARGNLDAASAAYGESLRIRRGLSDPQQPQTLRDVSVSLNKVGGVEEARGNLDAASAAYGESLRIRRGLSDPQQPQTLRDVSVSLDRVGGVEEARGNLDAASAAYGESLRIRRGLSDPQQPQTLRDVSVSLDNVGGVEMARGNLDAASAAYGESLRIARGLSDPQQPQTLRDVSISLDNVGGVEMARGNLDAASAAYGESLRIRRGLSDPQQPQTLRDVSVSLDRVGGVEEARGNLDAASAAYGESLRIRRGLSDPQQPQTLRDVSVSLNNVGGVQKARGNLDAASAAYGEMLRICRGLSDPQQPQTLRDVSVSLDSVGVVEKARGNLDAASAAYGESLRIRRGLSDPQQPQTLRDVSVSLDNVGGVEMARGKHGEARKYFEESLRILTNLQRDGKLFPQWRNDITWVTQQLARLDSETRGGAQVDIPRGHPGAAADRAAALNIAYLKDLAAWNALPFWKRLVTKKPQPPEGI